MITCDSWICLISASHYANKMVHLAAAHLGTEKGYSCKSKRMSKLNKIDFNTNKETTMQ